MMTENKQKLVPAIRFNGFTDTWEQRKLGEVAEFNPKSMLPDVFEYVDLESVVGTDLVTHRRESKVTAPSRAQRLAQRGDVFYQTVRPYQKNNYLYDLPYDNYVFSTGYAQMRPTINSYFLLSRVQEQLFVKTVLDRSTGTSYPAINSNELAEIDIKVPVDSDEQAKIGSFFKNLDNLITLHKRKLDGLLEMKKGYMQQMFPQAGEREPRVRFAGFSGEWQEQKLGELFKERNERSSDGEMISVTINSGVIKASELERKDNSSEDKSNYKKVEVGDIAYNSMRMWQGASGISNYTGILSPAYTVIIPNEGVDSSFFSYMFKLTRMLKIFQSFSQGLTSDTWNLKFPLLKEIYVRVPCSNEQAAISDFFCIIDEQITAQAIKLEQLGQLKAAYLQRMFI